MSDYRVTIPRVTITTLPGSEKPKTWGACPICGALVTFSRTQAGAVRNVRRHALKDHGATLTKIAPSAA